MPITLKEIIVSTRRQIRTPRNCLWPPLQVIAPINLRPLPIRPLIFSITMQIAPPNTARLWLRMWGRVKITNFRVCLKRIRPRASQQLRYSIIRRRLSFSSKRNHNGVIKSLTCRKYWQSISTKAKWWWLNPSSSIKEAKTLYMPTLITTTRCLPWLPCKEESPREGYTWRLSSITIINFLQRQIIIAKQEHNRLRQQATARPHPSIGPGHSLFTTKMHKCPISHHTDLSRGINISITSNCMPYWPQRKETQARDWPILIWTTHAQISTTIPSKAWTSSRG